MISWHILPWEGDVGVMRFALVQGIMLTWLLLECGSPLPMCTKDAARSAWNLYEVRAPNAPVPTFRGNQWREGLQTV